MKVLTARQMRELDSGAVDLGIPSRVLMERAGVSVVMAMEHELGDLRGLKYTVLCGKGNNGGDGFVVARTLLDYSDDVTVISISKDLGGDSLENMKLFSRLGGRIEIFGKEVDEDGLREILGESDVVVDALLGIGAKGELRYPISDIVDLVNSSDSYKVCVDIPTGVDSDTGKILGKAVGCDLTVTFAFPKIGHILYPGREYTGKLKVASIGIPKRLSGDVNPSRWLIDSEMVSSLIPKRPRDSSKGTFGRVFILAGSRRYTGAPVLVGMGALKSGAGLVFVAVPEPFNTVVTTSHPELIALPLKSDDGYVNPESLDEFGDVLGRSDVLAIGPGLSIGEGVKRAVVKLLEMDKPVVLDADGINNIAGDAKLLGDRRAPTVLTPHPGEFARLVGKRVEEVKYDYSLAERFASDHGIVLVLKGATTIVTDGKRTFFNLTGDTGLAKGGSGDVLTGIVASLMAQGLGPLEASLVGVYIHGLSTDYYDNDQSGMVPSDVIELLPRVLNDLR